MANKDKELMIALGIPEDDAEAEGEVEAEQTYLDSKPAELKGYLLDATNPDLSPEERAEALCRALEYSPEAVEVEEEPVDLYSDEE